MIRRFTACTGVLVAGVLLAGCSGTGAGLAARVGNTRITTSALAGYVSRGLQDSTFAQAHPQADYQRDWLGRLVRNALVTEAARRLHAKITDADVARREQIFINDAGGLAQLEAQAAQSGFAKPDLHIAIRNFTLQDAVADKLVADITVPDSALRQAYDGNLAQFDTAHIAHILVRTQAEAETVVSAARKGEDFAALAKQYSKDPDTSQSGGDLGQIGNGDQKFDPTFERVVFTGHTGDVIGPIKAASGFEIVKVIERRTRSFADARDDLRRQLIGTTRDQRFAEYIVNLAQRVGVHVNPRFGRWDEQSGAIADTGGNFLSSPAPVPGQNRAPTASPSPTAP